MKHKTCSFVTLMLLFGLATTAAWAGPGRGGRGKELRRLPIERLAERLELTTGEVEQLKAIDHERVAQTAELKATESVLAYELEGLMTVAEPDKAAVFAKIDDIARVRSEIAKVRFTARIEMKKVLGDRANQLHRFMDRGERQERRQARRALRRRDAVPAPEAAPEP